MDRLFTEPQWRAIAEVERRTEGMERAIEICQSKPLLGGAFKCGDFRLGWIFGYRHCTLMGPDRPEYFVYEAASELAFTWAVAEPSSYVIEGARIRIQLIGDDYLAEMLATGRAELAEWRAREAAEAAEREAERLAKAALKIKKLPKRARLVFEASGGKCHYCGCTLELGGKWHIEHKMPRALKGGNEMHNLVAACVPCNLRKRDKTDLEFQALLATESALAQAAQSGVVSADPSGFDSLSLHGPQFWAGEVLNATQSSGEPL